MTHPPASFTPPSQGYASLLADIKQRVRQAQVRAMLSVNAELIRLYWGSAKSFMSASGKRAGVRA